MGFCVPLQVRRMITAPIDTFACHVHARCTPACVESFVGSSVVERLVDSVRVRARSRSSVLVSFACTPGIYVYVHLVYNLGCYYTYVYVHFTVGSRIHAKNLGGAQHKATPAVYPCQAFGFVHIIIFIYLWIRWCLYNDITAIHILYTQPTQQ